MKLDRFDFIAIVLGFGLAVFFGCGKQPDVTPPNVPPGMEAHKFEVENVELEGHSANAALEKFRLETLIRSTEE